MEFSGVTEALEKRSKKKVRNKTYQVVTWKPKKQAPGGVFWVGVRNRCSDTSTTAAVFLLANVLSVNFHTSNRLRSTTVVVDHLDADLPLRDASEYSSNPRNMCWIMQNVRPPPGNMS